MLLGFAAIGLVVAAFIIFNTFTILVAQRTHELGLLRAMGASRRQIIVSVVIEAGVIGSVASVAGLALGVLLAGILFSVVGALGFDVPQGDLVFETRTAVAAIAVGMFVTVGASVWPAFRAATIPPVAAINDLPALRTLTFRRRTLAGGALIVAGVPVLLVGIAQSQSADDVLSSLRVVGVGALLVFFGVIVLLATFARPLAGALGLPVRAATGVTGAIARGNAMRNPRRTAATASALVIGLALVEMVAIFGESAKASVRSSDNDLRADLVIDTKQFSGFSPEVVTRLAALPEVDDAVGFRFGSVRPVTTVGDDEERVVGMNGTGLEDVVDLQMQRGQRGRHRRRRHARVRRGSAALRPVAGRSHAPPVPRARDRRARRRDLRAGRSVLRVAVRDLRARSSNRGLPKPTSTTARTPPPRAASPSTPRARRPPPSCVTTSPTSRS